MEYETATYQTSSSALSAGEAAALGGIFLVFGVVALALIALMLAAMWKIFTKAGEKGYKALIPVYNAWIFLRLGDQAGWWAIVALIPIANFVALIFMIIAAYNVGLKLGKEGWFVILYIFVPFIWALILAFDKSTWKNTPAGRVSAPDGAPAFTPAKPSVNSADAEDSK